MDVGRSGRFGELARVQTISPIALFISLSRRDKDTP